MLTNWAFSFLEMTEEEDKGVKEDNDASYGWLEEIEMPEESEMDVIQYLGPQVSETP